MSELPTMTTRQAAEEFQRTGRPQAYVVAADDPIFRRGGVVSSFRPLEPRGSHAVPRTAESDTRPAKPRPNDWAASVHESGHAHTCLALGVPVQSVHLCHDGSGFVEHGHLADGDWRALPITLAGIVAERKAGGHFDWWPVPQSEVRWPQWRSDIEKCRGVTASEERRAATVAIRHVTSNWKAIEKTAAHLYEHGACSGERCEFHHVTYGSI